MLRFVLALILLAVLTSDASACDRGARRGGFFARVVATERAMLRMPLQVASAPVRVVVSRTTTSSATSGYSFRSYGATPRFLFIPIPVR